MTLRVARLPQRCLVRYWELCLEIRWRQRSRARKELALLAQKELWLSGSYFSVSSIACMSDELCKTGALWTQTEGIETCSMQTPKRHPLLPAGVTQIYARLLRRKRVRSFTAKMRRHRVRLGPTILHSRTMMPSAMTRKKTTCSTYYIRHK